VHLASRSAASSDSNCAMVLCALSRSQTSTSISAITRSPNIGQGLGSEAGKDLPPLLEGWGVPTGNLLPLSDEV
jgi:hypothetical protein